MLGVIDSFVISVKNKIFCAYTAIKEDEKGVSNIVATVILILIVVLLAGIFWKQLSAWFQELWARITKGAEEIQ